MTKSEGESSLSQGSERVQSHQHVNGTIVEDSWLKSLALTNVDVSVPAKL